jgi:hypothetical protein
MVGKRSAPGRTRQQDGKGDKESFMAHSSFAGAAGGESSGTWRRLSPPSWAKRSASAALTRYFSAAATASSLKVACRNSSSLRPRTPVVATILPVPARPEATWERLPALTAAAWPVRRTLRIRTQPVLPAALIWYQAPSRFRMSTFVRR